jgi:hypothetical protein
MVENRFENMSSGNPLPVVGISRRELLKRGGKVAAAAAVSSVFSPFVLLEKQPRKKHSHSGSSMLPPDSLIFKANGLKTVSRVGMRLTMSRSTFSMSQFRTI